MAISTPEVKGVYPNIIACVHDSGIVWYGVVWPQKWRFFLMLAVMLVIFIRLGWVRFCLLLGGLTFFPLCWW